jgi:hypothetical protein
MSGEEWFSIDLAKGLSRVYSNSHVQTFVDAEEYFVDLRKEVEATDKGSQICWIGFEGSGDTPMPASVANNKVKPFPPRPNDELRDTTWFELLESASDARGVAIRVLLNLHPNPDTNPSAPKKYMTANLDLVEKLNALHNCLAINDFRYLWMNGTPCGQNSHPRPGEVDDSECFKSFWAFPLCASFSTSQSALESHFHKKTEGPVNDLDADAVIYHWDCGPGTAAAE